MKGFQKWQYITFVACIVTIFYIGYDFLKTGNIVKLIFEAFLLAFFEGSFLGLWFAIRKKGYQTEVDVSRFLGKDAKGALSFGNIGLLTYNDEYIVTWASDFFKERGIHIVNNKLTSWIQDTRKLFEDEVDYVIGEYEDSYYEISRKVNSNVIYVRDVTSYQKLSKQYLENAIVVGLLQLDNYLEYQSFENEETMAQINMKLRGPLISWAKEHNMVVRRTRADRLFVVLNKKSFEELKQDNFSILQIVKDEANRLDVSITLSMAFAYGSNDFSDLDDMVNQLIELTQSRGGDQVAFRNMNGPVQYVGGNSEGGSTRSKVRVHTMAQSIQGAMRDTDKIFIVGHVDTDFDCMGAALGMSSWAKALGKTAYIALRDVSRDTQLDDVMQHFKQQLLDRHKFVTPNEAMEMMDFENDLLILVDHGIPAISSARPFIDNCKNILVIDHHRRSDSFVDNPMLTYVEPAASSTCELIVELIGNVPNHVPIYESEATIMYLGILVDTNRFKMHSDARTFEAAAALRSWGANANLAEKALCIDYTDFVIENHLINLAQWVFSRYMVVCIDGQPVEKTMLAKVAHSLLLIKGCDASFVIARLENKEKVTAVSARSTGAYNVQKIMEKLNGGGHFTAAAVERTDLDPQKCKEKLIQLLEEEEHESNPA